MVRWATVDRLAVWDMSAWDRVTKREPQVRRRKRWLSRRYLVSPPIGSRRVGGSSAIDEEGYSGVNAPECALCFETQFRVMNGWENQPCHR